MSENVKKTVKWFLLDKNPPIIKFDEDEESYVVSDNVISKSNFSKYPINKGDIVEVGIKDNEVTFIKKQNKFNKKSSNSSTSSKATVTSVTKTLTVEAVYKNESIKFKEENINGKKWCPISPELSTDDLKSIGVVAKNQITVEITDGIITSINLVASEKEQPKTEEKETQTYAKKTSYRDEDSTDKRTALMTAKDLVVALINNGKIEKENIPLAIDELTKTCFISLQNL